MYKILSHGCQSSGAPLTYKSSCVYIGNVWAVSSVLAVRSREAPKVVVHGSQHLVVRLQLAGCSQKRLLARRNGPHGADHRVLHLHQRPHLHWDLGRVFFLELMCCMLVEAGSSEPLSVEPASNSVVVPSRANACVLYNAFCLCSAPSGVQGMRLRTYFIQVHAEVRATPQLVQMAA